MKILFTGHRGFLGRELIPLLHPFMEIVTFEGDLRDTHLVKDFVRRNKIEKIIHAAAKGVNRAEIQSEKTLCDNLQMSVNLAFTELPMLTFCSGKIFGYQTAIEGAKETECLSRFPEDFYGQSKYIFFALAKDLKNVSFVRFFNVFGFNEEESRLVKANIQRGLRGHDMVVHQDLLMDTFYAADVLPLIQDWVEGVEIPRNINMVYEKKLKLSEICAIINEFLPMPVKIRVIDSSNGKNYFGNGELLLETGYSMKGIKQGIADIVNSYKGLL